jgi:apolipoprotein N-acyltransferase
MRLAAALLLGALLPLAFAPYSLWPLAILIPALLLTLIQGKPGLRGVFHLGMAFGLGYFGFGVYWIYNSLHDFGMAPPLVAGGITGLLVVVLALFPALMLTFWYYSKQRFGDISLWLLPLYWFGMEWFKGWFATGLPWLSLGYSQTGSPLAGYAPIVGVYGIGLLCMLMAVALFLLLRDRRYPLLAILLLIPLAGWLLQQLDWSEAQQNSLRVTMVQGNIPQEIKWRYEQRQNIFNTYWRETSQHWGSDLIIWPETALPGQSEELEQSVLRPLQQAAIENDSTLITGLVVSESENNRYYNSVMMLGSARGVYHKRHLVLFGEYYPMRGLLDLFSGLISIPYSDLTPGPRDQPLMRVNGSTLGVSICFEDVFSRQILLALPEANLLVNVSNDAWFGNSTAPHQHLQIAQMRALETARPMLRSTNTGVSAFIDHRGRVMAQSGEFTTESVSQVVQGRSGLTPFYYFAKIQGWLAPMPFLVAFVLARRKAA